MEPNAQQRADLAKRIATARLDRFDGNRKKAYTAAGINSNTWTRAEKGDTVAERSLVAIVKLLWPETGGDWQRIDPPLSEIPNRLPAEMLEEIEQQLSPETRAFILGQLAERGEGT